jgi:UDP-N-acetylmuramyl pentapeptide synthase
MNRPGEIGYLAGLLRPDIGIITDIANAHRESFGSLEEIAREKAQLAAQVPVSGTVILDRDSEWFDLICEHTCASVLTLSMGGNADYVGYAKESGMLSVEHPASDMNPSRFPVPLPGEHMKKNALRAIALGLELGLSPAGVAEGLGKFTPAPMRWETSEIHGITFINDAYNANPLSMRAALETFAALPDAGKRWAVIGGMRELGATAIAEHAALGRFIDTLGLEGVITVGALGKAVDCSGPAFCFHVPATAEVAPVLKNYLHAGDTVLLKASRYERLEQVLNFFRET